MQKKILLTINDAPVYSDEFLKLYNKNIELIVDEEQKNINNYLNLFINYKLKVKEAYTLGLDKKQSFKNEFNTYKQQLLNKYLTDKTITESLIKEAYNRKLYEIKARHVLIRLQPNATPKDTLEAYNRLLQITKELKNKGFKSIKKQLHNGKSVFVENLGYFTVFDMAYNFETAAYNTKVGRISKPFKTRFGYHIIEVLDKKKAAGKIEVAHILIKNKTGENAKNRINVIYKKLQQGDSFKNLAEQFSDDKSSARVGGKIKPFKKGTLSSETFENVAFTLNKKTPLSKPFKTKFGWHIIKFFNLKPIPIYNDIKEDIKTKITRTDRNKIIDQALYTSIKNTYKVTEHPECKTYFKSKLTTNYFSNKWRVPEYLKLNKPVISIDNFTATYNDFALYLLNKQKQTPSNKTINYVVNTYYKSFINETLLKYKKKRLEKENQEYASILNEYKEGLLLFNLMEKKIWNASKQDSIGLQTFFETNKSKYVENERIDAEVAASNSKKTIKKVSQLLHQGASINTIKTACNTHGKVNVIFTHTLMDKNHQALPSNFIFKKGISRIYKHHDGYIVARVNNILPKTQKTLNQVRGTVYGDYQDYKEKQWLKSLKNKYTIKINKTVLEEIKSNI